MNLNELREAIASDATKENASLKEENASLKEENARLRQMVENLKRNYTSDTADLKDDLRALSNRCFALTHGTMCCFCELSRYRCQHSTVDCDCIEVLRGQQKEGL